MYPTSWGRSRRVFIRTIALAPAVSRAWAAEAPRTVRFGIISDVHQDVMPDAEERIRSFGKAMAERRPDFVVQCGDFCIPKPENAAFLRAWNEIACPRYHVLGNHDMDGGKTRQDAVAFYGMSHRYYTFQAGPIRGVVLDGNDPGGAAKGYARSIARDQQRWLAAELEKDAEPAILFIHQPLDDAGGVENAQEIEALLETALARRPGCVAAIFAGHLHRDYVRSVAGIPSIQVNSASYVWLGGNHAAASYPPAIHRDHRSLANVAPYREPLWAFVTLDRASCEMTVEGRSTEWVGADPWTRGAPESMCKRDDCHPAISDRVVRIS